MLTYPKSTMRVRRMTMHSSSGHVTLMPEKFYRFLLYFPLIFPNRTQGAGRTHVGLCPNFQFFSTRKIPEMRGPTGVKFCTIVSTKPNFIMLVQNFDRCTTKKFQGQKTCKLWPDFGRLRSSAANISETHENIQDRIVIPSIAIHPALGETSPVKFGKVTLKIQM